MCRPQLTQHLAHRVDCRYWELDLSKIFSVRLDLAASIYADPPGKRGMVKLSASGGAQLTEALFSSDKFLTADIRSALKSILNTPSISATFDVSPSHHRHRKHKPIPPYVSSLRPPVYPTPP